MVLCAARLHTTVMVSYLACVKTDMEAHEIIWNCRLLYSIDREKPYQPVTFSFAVRICSEYGDHFKWNGFTSGFCCITKNDSVLLMKLVKLVTGLYSYNSYA